MPEPEEPFSIEETFAEIVAGQGLVRRVVLYVLIAFGIMLTATPIDIVGGLIAFPSLILLMATDKGLS